MDSLKTELIIIIFILISSILVAQNQNEVPCSGEKYEQFDFWEGNWKVYDKEGDLVGTNKVIKLQNDCVLQENWVSKLSKNTGTSYNYYNPKDDTWNQIWIDNSGFIMNLKGHFKDGKMILKSDLVEANPRSFANQITWKKNKDNTVTQIWTTVDEKGKVIYEIFYGIYKKQGNI
ncbi:hypothetical protein [Polaribacter gangjinensis]|uniref:Uncharacterized protein n=1 Tax=Polaribacter gangjinensis TaxID=574710 RepID=A0A2S7WEB0_9FLAO|nr:hypothetical protein [Polaribacter gangjinensis]PQJ75969.1 hypothetical protein BTO13_12370 [Polaribacter gangjinensis]